MSKSKRSQSLSTKISLANAVTLILLSGIVTCVSLLVMYRHTADSVQETAVVAMRALEKDVNNRETNLLDAAQAFSLDESIIAAIEAKNRTKLVDGIIDLKKDFIYDAAYVTDAKGAVLARYHEPEVYGDDLSTYQIVQTALAGEKVSQIGTDPDVGYSITAAVPVYEKNSLIGTISLAYKLDDPAILASLKEETDCDYMIFDGETELNTTISGKNGQSTIGTALESKISNTVLQQKQEYQGEERISGSDYRAIYMPVLSADQTAVTGVFFCGKNMSTLQMDVFVTILVILGIVLLGVLASIYIFSRFMNAKFRRPIRKMVDMADALAVGNISVSIEEGRTDEIGQLMSAFSSMIHNIQNQVNVAVKLAEGDLTVEYIPHSDQDTMGNAFVKIISALNQMFAAVLRSSREVNAGAEQVANAAQMLSQGTTEQASSIEELAATINDISRQVESNAQNASNARDLSLRTEKEVEKGNTQMQEMISAMNEINTSSMEISKIIKVIDDIAFQTNILALNAAVEAARAGNAGKGFAVVADEVRNLAAKSADAAKTTTALIETSIASVSEGTKIADTTAQSLHSIVASVDEIVQKINDIDTASAQQAMALSQITQGIDQISAVVQNNSATAEETAASSEEMSGQANMLSQLLSSLKLSEEEGHPDRENYSSSDFTIDLSDDEKYSTYA